MRNLPADRELFHNWRNVRDGTWKRDEFLKQHKILSAEFHTVLDDGTRCADRGTSSLCRNLFSGFENLWHFANDKTMSIEPTNNAAERALRRPVIWKPLSFGPQSVSGSRFVETLLSVAEACRQQDRNVLDDLYQSLTARLNGKRAPSLLPNRA